VALRRQEIDLDRRIRAVDGRSAQLPLNDFDLSADEVNVNLNQVMRIAVGLNASDVHLKVGQPPIVRVDGQLEQLEGFDPLTSEELEETLNEVGATSPRRIAVFHETGELDTAYQLPGLPRFRINAFRQRGDISFACRVIPSEVPTFGSLGLPPGVQKLAEEHRGLVLVTGATGSGKTTTLASMLGYINQTRRQHIVSIEDPIEILHTDINCIVSQREVGLDTESFHEALRRVLRQDPDIILIGELRDMETAETALQAAESGHLVLATMHTVDAAETVGRFAEFFPAITQPAVRSILAGVMKGVVSQRLLPRVGGGRIAAVEVMITNNRIQELIRDNKPEYIPEAVAEGSFFQMQTITQALIAAVIAGSVEQDVAAAAAPNRHDFSIALDRALKEHALAQPAVGLAPESEEVLAGPTAGENGDGLRAG
jgi:twitching motility protein PilT